VLLPVRRRVGRRRRGSPAACRTPVREDSPGLLPDHRRRV